MATYSQKNIFAYSTLKPVCLEALVAAPSSAAIEKGTVMAYNTNTNKWTPFVNGGSNGVGTAKAILAERLEISDADVMSTVVFQGAFVKTALVGYDANAVTSFGAKVEEIVTPRGTVVFLRY